MARLPGGASGGPYEESDEEVAKWQKLIRRFRKAGIEPGSGVGLPMRVKFHKLNKGLKGSWQGQEKTGLCMAIFKSVEPGYEGLFFFGKKGAYGLDVKAELYKVVCAAIKRSLGDDEEYLPEKAIGNELIVKITPNPMDEPSEQRGGYFWNIVGYEPLVVEPDDDDEEEPAPRRTQEVAGQAVTKALRDLEERPTPSPQANDKATLRQVKFIYAIAKEAGLDEDELASWSVELFGEEPENITRRDASALIEQLQRRRAEVEAAPDDQPATPKRSRQAAPPVEEDEDLPEWAQ